MRYKGRTAITAGTALLVLGACNGNEDPDNDAQDLQAEVGNLEQRLAEKEIELDERDEQIADLESQLEALQEDDETDDVEEDEDDGNGTDEEISNGEEADDTDNGTEADEDQLRDRADDVVAALENENFESLAQIVHPEEGIRFSPYGHVNPDEDLQFEAEEVERFGDDEEVYEWGVQDGSGYPIELTPQEYYEDYIYIRDFSRESEEILINEIESHGNVEVNVEEEYSEAAFVSYFVSAGDEELDWANLILSFEEHEGEWYVTGLTVDRWTT